MIKNLDFEQVIEQIDNKILLLEESKDLNNKKKIDKLINEKINSLSKIYSNLNSWQKVQIARHPHTSSFLSIDYSKFYF